MTNQNEIKSHILSNSLNALLKYEIFEPIRA